MMRLKALMAYYKGMKLETLVQAYDIGVKSLKQWIKKFEAEAELGDKPRSGRPSKLPPEKK
jgi:transposase